MADSSKNTQSENKSELSVINPTIPTQSPNYANLLIRFAAYLFDRFFFFFPLFAVVVLFPPTKSDALTWTLYQNTNKIGFVYGILFICYLIVSTRVYGKTLGKHILGLKVVREDGGKISWGRAIAREFLFRLLSEILLLGYLYALINKKHQAFHDKVTNILVVQEKSLTRYRKIIATIMLLGIPVIWIVFTYNYVAIPFSLPKPRQYLITAIQRKIAYLGEISTEPNSICPDFFRQAESVFYSYCNDFVPQTEGIGCSIFDLQVEELEEFNLKLEEKINECIRLQSKE